MRCPECKSHVTPFEEWRGKVAGSFIAPLCFWRTSDMPIGCSNCRVWLKPNGQTRWWCFVGFLIATPLTITLIWAIAWVFLDVGFWEPFDLLFGAFQFLQPLWVVVCGVVFLAIFYICFYSALYVRWRTGRYQRESSETESAKKYRPENLDVQQPRSIGRSLIKHSWVVLFGGFVFWYVLDYVRENCGSVLTLKGHTNEVSAVAWSPDGERIATASRDKTAKVWDSQTGRELLTLHGHIDGVTSVCFSPDGKQILTGSLDKTARVWDAQTGKELLNLKGCSHRVWSVAFSPDGRHILIGDASTAKVCDSRTGKDLVNLTDLKGRGDWVYWATFSPDGKRIVTGSSAAIASVWDAQTGKELLTLNGHTDWVFRVAFSPDGKRIVTGGGSPTHPEKGEANVWDTETGKEILNLKGHKKLVSSVAFSPDGKYLLTGSWDRTVKCWAVESGNQVNSLLSHTRNETVNGLALSPDGSQVVIARWSSARIWSTPWSTKSGRD